MTNRYQLIDLSLDAVIIALKTKREAIILAPVWADTWQRVVAIRDIETDEMSIYCPLEKKKEKYGAN
jgi:hypothetical protein